jgi:xanthine dehydrogenase YagT iron-sulfur-binding subunit
VVTVGQPAGGDGGGGDGPTAVALDDDEIRERMSGNLCRCAAYANIVPAIQEAARR